MKRIRCSSSRAIEFTITQSVRQGEVWDNLDKLVLGRFQLEGWQHFQHTGRGAVLDKWSWCFMLQGASVVSCLSKEIPPSSRHTSTVFPSYFPTPFQRLLWLHKLHQVFSEPLGKLLTVTFRASFLVYLLFLKNSQILLGIHEDELLPQDSSQLCHCASPPSWYFCQPYMLICPSKRHHFLLSNGHTGSLFDSSSFNTNLGSVQRIPAIKKKKQNHVPYAVEEPSIFGGVSVFLTCKEPQSFICFIQCS